MAQKSQIFFTSQLCTRFFFKKEMESPSSLSYSTSTTPNNKPTPVRRTTSIEREARCPNLTDEIDVVKRITKLREREARRSSETLPMVVIEEEEGEASEGVTAIARKYPF